MAYADLEKRRLWRRNHPEISKRWQENNPVQYRKTSLDCKAKHRYGITREEQVRLYQQPCEICGKRAKKMCIDHVIPGTYRGVLCQLCNGRLGWFEKFQNIILEYTKRGPQNAIR